MLPVQLKLSLLLCAMPLVLTVLMPLLSLCQMTPGPDLEQSLKPRLAPFHPITSPGPRLWLAVGKGEIPITHLPAVTSSWTTNMTSCATECRVSTSLLRLILSRSHSSLMPLMDQSSAQPAPVRSIPLFTSVPRWSPVHTCPFSQSVHPSPPTSPTPFTAVRSTADQHSQQQKRTVSSAETTHPHSGHASPPLRL